jgi:hypothetical protein
VAQIATEAVEFPDDERVAAAKRLQAGSQTGAILSFSRRGVLIDIAGLDASLSQRIALKVVNLAAVSFRHPRISDQGCHLFVRLRDNFDLAAPKPVDCHITRLAK